MPVNLGQVQAIECARIRPFSGQPRKRFDKFELASLEASIKSVGQRTPAKVRPLSGQQHDFELVDGERRFRVCSKLGIPLKAWIEDSSDQQDQFVDSVISNFCRAGHDELEIFEAIIRLKEKSGYTSEEVAAMFGKTAGWVAQYLSLRRLKPGILALLSAELPEKHRLTFTHALCISRLPASDQQQAVDVIHKRGLRLAQVKTLVDSKLSGRVALRPRKEADKLRNFIRRTSADTEVLLSKTVDYYRSVLEAIGLSERAALIDSLDEAAKDLEMLANTLRDRTQAALPRAV